MSGQPQRTGVFATIAKAFRPSTAPALPAYTTPDTTGSGATPGLLPDPSTQRSTRLGAKVAKALRPSTAPSERAYFAPQGSGTRSGELTKQETAEVNEAASKTLKGNTDAGHKTPDRAPADDASVPLVSLAGLDSPRRAANHAQAGQSQAPSSPPQPAREAAQDAELALAREKSA